MSEHNSTLRCISRIYGTPFGVFRAAPEHGGAEGLHTASVLHPCLWLCDSTLLADDSLALATT